MKKDYNYLEKRPIEMLRDLLSEKEMVEKIIATKYRDREEATGYRINLINSSIKSYKEFLKEINSRISSIKKHIK